MPANPNAAPRRPGRHRATSQAVARLAGVSQATVSNVINRPDIVADATRERVLKAMETLNFVANRAARDLRSGSGTACGVIVLDIANPFWGQVTRGIESVTAPLGHPVILASSNESSQVEAGLIAQMDADGVRGMLVAPAADSLDVLWQHSSQGAQIVLIDHEDPSGQLRSVVLDHVAGARLAARHLLANGHRHVAMVVGPQSNHWCRARQRGFTEVYHAAGIDPLIIQVAGMTLHSGLSSAQQVADATNTTAVFCVNDLVALGLLKGLLDRNIAVPDQLSIIGYDDAEFSAMLSPALTTVRQSPFAIGAAAARLLYDLDTAAPPSGSLIAPTLIDRQSVRAI